MIRKIDHIGIAVKSLEAALPFYEKQLGLKATRFEEIPDQKVRVAMLPAGEATIELLEPTSPDSPVAKFLEKRGEGIHHIAFAVDDIAAALRKLDKSGVCLVDKTPRRGESGKQIAFIHPKSAFGSLLELTEAPHHSD